MSGVRRLSCSLSAWFCLPEQGMEGFEILSRASAFLVKADSEAMRKNGRSSFPVGHPSTYGSRAAEKAGVNFIPTHHLVTSSHVVSPWRWPRYYPDEWLQFVNEKHTHYTVEVRDDSGVFICQVECNPVVYNHPNKDLAILHLADEAESLSLLEEVGFEHTSMLAPGKSKQFIVPGVDLKFFGHNVTGTTASGRGDGAGAQQSNFDPTHGNGNGGGGDERRPIPQTVAGEIVHRSDAGQIFCSTHSVLTDGMCGGPVMMVSDDRDGSAEQVRRVCGMVEGIVPTDHPADAIRGLAVFIESDDILDFAREVEQGNGVVEPLLGGQSLDHVGSVDKDPDRDMHEAQP